MNNSNPFFQTPSRLALLAALLLGSAACAVAVENPPSLFIEGYAGQLSVAPGEEVTFHVSTGAAKFDVEIVRLGAQKETVWSRKDVPGQAHPVPEDASSGGCQWPESFRVPVPKEWRSGYYEVTLRAADSGGKFVQRGRRTAESSCFFVVRSAAPGRDTKVLLQLSANTYNAYNNWGGSLYAGNWSYGLRGGDKAVERITKNVLDRLSK